MNAHTRVTKSSPVKKVGLEVEIDLETVFKRNMGKMTPTVLMMIALVHLGRHKSAKLQRISALAAQELALKGFAFADSEAVAAIEAFTEPEKEVLFHGAL